MSAKMRIYSNSLHEFQRASLSKVRCLCARTLILLWFCILVDEAIQATKPVTLDHLSPENGRVEKKARWSEYYNSVSFVLGSINITLYIDDLYPSG
jgi:hypothetical protein